jgi:hypothetical protein
MELTSAAEAKKRRQKKQRNKERSAESAESAERQILKAKAKGERHKVKKHK